MSGEIVFYSKMDGTVNALAKSQNSPGPIALSAINVFWANQSPNSPALMKMPLAGGNPTSMAIVNNAPIDIAFGGGDLYWLEHDGGTKGFVKRIAQAGGGNPNSLFSSNAEPKAIDVSVGDVYWSDASPNDPSIKLTKSGGGTNTIIPMLGNPADLIVFQSYIYFIDAGNATVNRAPVAGGQVEPLYAGPPWPRHIGVDAKYVYWTSDSGTVTRVPLGGGMAEDIAIKFKDLGAIAVDDTFVFFADQQSSVYAARK